MIISASRRTDIPCYYSPWFMNRLKAGFVSVRNPFNHSQVSTLSLRPEEVDCVVFWTKDPLPMMNRLGEISNLGYEYYFHFTLTPYGKNIERKLRDKNEIEDTFLSLSALISPRRLVWRYDPIILDDLHTRQWHKTQFERLCSKFSGRAEKIAISFADIYARLKPGTLREISDGEMDEVAWDFSSVAGKYGLSVSACCEKRDFSGFGIGRASCIDKDLIEKLLGRPIDAKPDKSQRPGCGCARSVDIGVYNTCPNGCVYCYATRGEDSALLNFSRHDPNGEMLL